MRSPARRLSGEIGLLVLAGLFLGAIGPFGTDHHPLLEKHLYWLINIVGGGLIGIAVDRAVGRFMARGWRRVIVVAVAMTPLVTFLVFANIALLIGGHRGGLHYFEMLLDVFVIALPVMAVRALVWREPERVVETRTVTVAPLPEAEAKFRRRLSAKLRTAPLLAVEAHDHYVRVHCREGTELLTLRFADAIAELEGVHGYRIHRSWWVSADAIESVRWRRGGGEVRLTDGSVIPVSRRYAPALREAGWR